MADMNPEKNIKDHMKPYINLPLPVMELASEFSNSEKGIEGSQNRQHTTRSIPNPCSQKLLRSCSLVDPRYNQYQDNRNPKQGGTPKIQRNSLIHSKIAGRGKRSFSCSSKDSSVISSNRNRMAFVPSPGLMNSHYSTSPYSSIYDQDVCGAVCRMSNPTMDATVPEDLDDKLEDSTLQNLLTSEVLHSLQSSIPISTDFPWVSKSDSIIPSNASTDSLGSNPTLTQLNMEPDMAIVEDILNMDSDENSAFDFLCSASNSPFNGFITGASDLATVSKSFVTTPASSQSQVSAKITPANGSSDRQKDSMNLNFLRANRNNFPPRGSQQPPVGVVAPVKKEEEPCDIFKNEKVTSKLNVQSPQLHKLLVNNQKTAIKSEPIQCCPITVAPKEMPAQIVPLSSDIMKKNSAIKSEPLSPEKATTKRGLVKEESTEEKWKDIENFINNPETQPPSKKRKRNNSGSSAHISDDDEDDDEDDRSIYGGNNYDDDSDDDYSDIDADLTSILPTECESLVATGKKQKQYFWQYNVQSKGPKGTRLKLAVDESADPHVLNDFEDPVFDESNTLVAGIRHGGKARKGDGNEITPNPKKLFMIGHQLLRLNRQINAFQLGQDVPVAKRNESKREKNKLASRACRLKKKAQHEANKIKLYGLEREHSQLNKVLQHIRPFLWEKARALMGQSVKTASGGSESLSQKLETHMKEFLSGKIAGNTVDYVNSVILQVEAGDNSGGLKVTRNQKT